jgi:hypothetical protein
MHIALFVHAFYAMNNEGPIESLALRRIPNSSKRNMMEDLLMLFLSRLPRQWSRDRRTPLPVAAHVKINRRRRTTSIVCHLYSHSTTLSSATNGRCASMGNRSIAEAKRHCQSFCAGLLKNYDAEVSTFHDAIDLSNIRSVVELSKWKAGHFGVRPAPTAHEAAEDFSDHITTLIMNAIRKENGEVDYARC